MKINKFLSIALILIGIVAIVFAILCSDLPVGSYVSSHSYGGDAYTGIQNAAADTGNNIRFVATGIKAIAQYAFILTGLILEAIGISGFFKGEKSKETSNVFIENKTTKPECAEEDKESE